MAVDLENDPIIMVHVGLVHAVMTGVHHVHIHIVAKFTVVLIRVNQSAGHPSDALSEVVIRVVRHLDHIKWHRAGQEGSSVLHGSTDHAQVRIIDIVVAGEERTIVVTIVHTITVFVETQLLTKIFLHFLLSHEEVGSKQHVSGSRSKELLFHESIEVIITRLVHETFFPESVARISTKRPAEELHNPIIILKPGAE